MISINHLNLLRNEKKVLNDINLTIRSGEVVILTGESGSGKSSLISVLNGLIPELYEGEITGEVTVLNTQLPPIHFTDYVKDIGVVFQNPKTQFFTTSVFSELAFSMENYGFSPNDIEKRMSDIISLFKLDDLLGKRVSELSGGQKQRIAFASACMLPHRLFLFDEPSSNLDYDTIDTLFSYMSILKKQGCTMIISEHRLFYLKELADRYVVLCEGQVVSDLLALEFESDFPTLQKSYGLRSLTEPQKVIPNIKLDTNVGSTQSLSINQLYFQYEKNSPAVDIDSLTLDTSSIIGLIGTNGSGKTTFVQLLTGLLAEKRSSFSFNHETLSAKQRLARSFLVMQDVNLQLFFETVEKELLVQSERKELFDEVVQELHLTELLTSHPQNLSGGEKQRVAIASAILSGKEWIILDEPTSGLDYRNMLSVSRLLKKVQSYGLFVLVISHDNEFLALTTSNIIQLDKGRVVNESFDK